MAQRSRVRFNVVMQIKWTGSLFACDRLHTYIEGRRRLHLSHIIYCENGLRINFCKHILINICKDTKIKKKSYQKETTF